jgi:hypothetical protein
MMVVLELIVIESLLPLQLLCMAVQLKKWRFGDDGRCQKESKCRCILMSRELTKMQ